MRRSRGVDEGLTMKRVSNFLLAGAFAIAAAGAASAADIPLPAPEPLPELPIIESRSGGYLRGDIGIGIYGDGSWSQQQVTAAHGRFLRESIGDGGFIGGGIGYKFNNWLRADLTAEYRASVDIHGVDEYKFNCTFAGGSCGFVGQEITRNNIWKGHLSSTVVMANLYADLGSWYGITPFVGGGVGMAYNRLTSVYDFDPSDLGGAGTVAENGEWSFAWALAAGLGYEVNDRLALELGYRYINLGDAESGRITCLGTAVCDLDPLIIEDIDSHDIRLGMRWHLGGGETYFPEPPLAVKY